MASNTTNLNLYKKDPIADKDQTFNITTMMNENWDKIDQNAGQTATQLAQIEEDFTLYKKQGFVTRISRATNLTGLQTINMGFRPKLVYAVAKLQNQTNINYGSHGVRVDGNSRNINRLGTGGMLTSNFEQFIMLHSGGAFNSAIATITDTGITLLWDKTGDLPSDNIIILLFAI